MVWRVPPDLRPSHSQPHWWLPVAKDARKEGKKGGKGEGKAAKEGEPSAPQSAEGKESPAKKEKTASQSPIFDWVKVKACPLSVGRSFWGWEGELGRVTPLLTGELCQRRQASLKSAWTHPRNPTWEDWLPKKWCGIKWTEQNPSKYLCTFFWKFSTFIPVLHSAQLFDIQLFGIFFDAIWIHLHTRVSRHLFGDNSAVDHLLMGSGFGFE